MKIGKLKETLGAQLIQDLEELGLVTDEHGDQNFNLYTTTDDYCEEKNEATWIASINDEKLQHILISSATLYDTTDDIDFNNILIDDNKAEMLLDAIFHAFPHLVDGMTKDKDKDETEVALDSIDEDIGAYKREIAQLEKLRIRKKVTSDKCIDVYHKLKKYASGHKDSCAKPEVIKRNKSIVFISSFKDKKLVKLVKADINNIVAEKIEDLPPKKISKTILIDKKLAKSLMGQIRKTFVKGDI